MSRTYAGPLMNERAAIELHNTLHAVAGEPVDGLADPASAEAFVTAVAPRLAVRDLPEGEWPTATELTALRQAVREALHASVEGAAQDAATLEAITAIAGQAPTSLRAELGADGAPTAVVDHHGATRAQSVLAAMAIDAIELITGPDRGKLRACHAPGCALYYLKDHPRRQWCSNTCGNRARQARHYQRTRRPG
ncbi:MAG TPA: ABATE domain-containing protein [Baekduia sp.]|jgi:predicted RNA-binding Zn ribbon-like protein